MKMSLNHTVKLIELFLKLHFVLLCIGGAFHSINSNGASFILLLLSHCPSHPWLSRWVMKQT